MKRSPLKRKTPLKRVSWLTKKHVEKRKDFEPNPQKVAFISKPPKKRNIHAIRIDPLDELFSRYIRLRDNYTCQRCGVKSKHVQCAHFHSRRKQSVRWDSDNACSLCMGDHLYLDGNPMEKVEFFRNRLGQKAFDLLNSRMRITRPRPDKKAIELWLRVEIQKMEE